MKILIHFSRISRNQQNILRKESYLDRTIDATNGSYFINHLITEILEEYNIKNIDSIPKRNKYQMGKPREYQKM